MKKINQNSKIKSQKYNSKIKSVLICFVVGFVVVISVFSFPFFVGKVQAATGINRQINFQGKLVDNNGLNVADSTYTVVFSLYSTSSGGTAIWTETDSVTTKAGIFQVALGATNSLPDNVDFNSDSLYLGIKVGSDAEMTPRIRFTAVPYAINSASLDGVVATQSATGFNLQGGTSSLSTLSFTNNGTALTFQPGVAEGLIIDTNGSYPLSLGSSASSISFGGSNNPTYTFNGNGGLTIDGTNETIGNGSNATIQTTGASTGLTLLSQGLGNITLGQNAGNGDVVISPNAGGQAALIVKDLGSGDLFTASSGANTRFTIANNGNVTDTNASALNFGSAALTVGSCTGCVSTLGFGSITGGTNATAAMVVGTGASLNFSASGTINASSLNGATFAAPGTIGGTTPGAASFTTATINSSGNALTLSGTNADIDFSGTGLGEIITAPNQNLDIDPGGNGDVGINASSNLAAALDVRGNTGTTPAASVSADSTFAAMVVNNSGSGDIFTASESGQTQFVINNDGTVSLSTSNYNACSVLATDANGNIYCSTSGDKETIASVYTITAPSGTNLHINFNGAADSAPSSSSGTITFPANTTKLSVELKGAGGGGGAETDTSSNLRGAGGGGEGGYSQKMITSLATDYYVKVGGGGAGGTATSDTTTPTAGGTGTSTCLGINSSDACNSPLSSATGGSGGGAVTAALPGTGGAAGSGSGGDLNLTGQPGFAGASVATVGGGGGGGIGGAVDNTTSANGTNGSNGGGGSGGLTSPASTTAHNGGNGGNGYITFTIYTNTNSGTTLGDNWYQYGDGVLAPISTTSDVLIGSNATASADFGFLNVGAGTPTASISAGSSTTGATYMTGNGMIQTTNNQTLTLGGSTTGNIILNPLAGNFVGIDTQNPLATLDIRGATGLNGGTLAVASVSGQTSFAGLVVDNSGVGDLFTASKSGATKFTILNNGNISMNNYNNCGMLTTVGTIVTCSAAPSVGTNYLQLNSGAISPFSTTADLLIGGTATSSAKFAFVNVDTGTPTASLSAGVSGGAYMTASGVIQTTANQTLSLGGTTTGNIILNPAAGNYVGIDTQTPLATLDVRGATGLNGGTVAVASVSGQTSFAAMVVNNNGVGDLFTASKSGATKFVVDNSGNIQFAGTNTVLSTLASAATSAVTWMLPNATGTICLQASANCGFALGTNEWEQIAGAISPTTITDDLLVGGTATTSARFAVTNMVGAGTPTASLSAGTSGGTYMTASGVIQTTANQTLSLGGTTTGNIILNPAAGNYVGIDTQTPLATLDVRGATGLNGGTVAVASVSGKTSFAAMVVNNSGTGDLFTASSAGRTKFTISNAGNIFFGGSIISASSSGQIGNGSPVQINALEDQGSLIPNAGFEADQSMSKLGDGWVPNASNAGTLTLDTAQADAAQGTNSIKWVSTGANQSVAFYSACVPITSGDGFDLTWSQKGTLGGGSTVRGYLDQYTTQANCQSNSGLTSSIAESTASTTTSWATPNAGINTITAATGTTWGRAHIYIASAANGANSTTYIDSVRLIESSTTTGLDYAEDYPADPNNVPQPGQVVSLEASGSGTMIAPSNVSMDQNMIGVISTNPGEVLDDGSMTNPVPVALAGRIPVNVSTANGPIQVGDYLTSSNVPGVAVKATAPGPVIGTAMEDFDCSTAITQDAEDPTNSLDSSGDNNVCQGQVILFVKNTYYDPTVASAADGNYDLLQNTDLSVFDASSSASASDSGILQPLYTIQTGAGIAVTSTAAFAQATIANIQAGAVVAKEISTDSLDITSGNITLGGQTLSDYIKGIVKQTLSEVDQTGSAPVSVNGLLTATPSAQLVQSILDQQDLSATVSGMTVTGILGADTINAKHIAGLTDLNAATVSAASISATTITADTINAKHISGLEVLTTGLQKDDARITALEDLVGSASATPAVSEPPTISPTEGITVLSNANDQSSVSSDLRVTGNGLIEGILHIAGTLFANDFIANGVSDFFGNVIFHSGVTFQQTPTFNSDTAGIAIIKKGTDHVDVKFTNAYDQIPVVNASITEVSLTPTPSETPSQMLQRQQEIEQQLLSDNIHFVVANRTITGFTILLDKPADEDIAFSWLALSVQNAVIIQSQDQPSPTQDDSILPSPIDTIIPTNIPTDAATNSAGF